jgi:hypothetical protein
MSLTESEFTTLRETIANRGTARLVLLPLTVIGWALVAGVITASGGSPVGALFSLAVLAAGFESIHALHTGVERIGRYLQVFYETEANGPKWETTAMAVGPALPGGGVDPLFSVLFAVAAIINIIPALMASPTRLETAVVGLCHLALLVRLVRARGAAARQRAVELESYRVIKSRHAGS